LTYDPAAPDSEDVDLQWKNYGTSSNDVSYDGISSDAGLSYVSSFGKIQAGEPLRVLLTVMNTSASYALEKLVIKVYVYRGKQKEALKAPNKNELVHESTI